MKKVKITDLKIIKTSNGDVMHVLKKSNSEYKGFGEAYFSQINYKKVKGWKCHTQMTSNLTVAHGAVRFVIKDDENKNTGYCEFILSKENYKRITIPPGIWFAFQGLEKPFSTILNISDIEHQPEESKNVDIEKFQFDWRLK